MATETKKKTASTAVKAPRAKAVKKPKEVEAAAEAAPAARLEAGSYINGLGRRKTAIARVKLVKNGTGQIKVNGRDAEVCFPGFELGGLVKMALKVVGIETGMDVIATVTGGGMRGQAEAVRLGVARALVELNPTYRKVLKKLGYMTRDPRSKERKKPGLKKARRSPQWSKR
jgi:small subunit ribosomal protein S9